MSFSIDGKCAIVTGAANGIGLAIARHFLDRGARVLVADTDEDRLQAEFGAEARGEGPLRLFAGDLRDKLTISNLLSATVDAFDRVDILINAARVVKMSDPLKPGEDMVDEMLQGNLMTSLRMTQMTARRMIAQRPPEDDRPTAGTIVNLSSIAARRSHLPFLGYSIACAALDQMTRSMALALAPQRIRVNAVSVGSVLSASLQSMLREAPDWRDAITAATPLGRIAPASEVVETVTYLASDASSFVTGQIIEIDGGRGLVDAATPPAH